MKPVESGTLLFYYRDFTLWDDLVDIGERFKGAPAPRCFYHVAVAVDARTKIEGVGRGVRREPIDYTRVFASVIPSVDPARQPAALHRLGGLIGQPYDWWLMVDDALRTLSGAVFGRPVLHLPTRFIESEKRRRKLCMSVARAYLMWAGSRVSIPGAATPQEAYDLLQSAGEQVAGSRRPDNRQWGHRRPDNRRPSGQT